MHQSSLMGAITSIWLPLYIRKSTTTKIKSFKAFFLGGHHFLHIQRKFPKYKGKYAFGPFLLSFLPARSYQLNSFVRLLHLYCCFRRHPYRRHWRPYIHMAIWPYSRNMAIWLYGIKGGQYESFWKQQQTQQSDEGIMLIRPSEQKWSDGKFSFVVLGISMYTHKILATKKKCLKTLD
jgi:hypothetical protein